MPVDSTHEAGTTMPEFLGHCVFAYRLPSVERLEPGRTVGMSKHVRADVAPRPNELTGGGLSLLAGRGVEGRVEEARERGQLVQHFADVANKAPAVLPGKSRPSRASPAAKR